MNIKITYNWLLEYLETDATPDQIREYLSLCGPSIESVTKVGNDYVFDIEVISNRIDYASVLGIAQEAIAILPMFGKRAGLKINPLAKYKFDKYYLTHDRRINNKKLNIVIKDKLLCPRFTAIVIENVKITPSPKFISERLIACGIKSINNVVDISNYLMLALGQPVHVFDYDQIKGQTMIMRESKKDEKIITLDEKEVILPGGDIVIEDGSGRLIDLCGIMGGLNSAITEKTKNVVLFVQIYDKVRIRKRTMAIGVRTVAATFFEKGLDPERVEPTLVYGVELLEKYAQGKIASKLYDIYPEKKKEKLLVMSYELFEKKIGVKISEKIINLILNNLGFGIDHLNNDRTKMVKIIVPSWRTNDISIPEDVIEEVARVYGYQNIPSRLQAPAYVEQPKDMDDLFVFQNKIKLFLKHLGLNEVINYSMISKSMIEDGGLKIEDHLRLSNSISEDIEYLRISLLPSLAKNMADNNGKRDTIKLFEIAKVYLKRVSPYKVSPYKESPCAEVYRLGIAVNTEYSDLKGIVEAVYGELNINVGNKNFCSVPDIIERAGIFMTEINLQSLIDNCQLVPKYTPLHPYAVIKLDKTFDLRANIKFAPTSFAQIKKIAFEKSKLLQKIEVVSVFENKFSLRFYYSSPDRNITEEEAKAELNKVRP
ncbi:MAG: Uncharacterized protein Athens101426_648 [Parcubacteria group bacterium Athens1014_26]|nr:MAG: Uncharacterized protein Athens101426_648 [Parcubacteria group bacterium Athens1014_26]